MREKDAAKLKAGTFIEVLWADAPPTIELVVDRLVGRNGNIQYFEFVIFNSVRGFGTLTIEPDQILRTVKLDTVWPVSGSDPTLRWSRLRFPLKVNLPVPLTALGVTIGTKKQYGRWCICWVTQWGENHSKRLTKTQAKEYLALGVPKHR